MGRRAGSDAPPGVCRHVVRPDVSQVPLVSITCTPIARPCPRRAMGVDATPAGVSLVVDRVPCRAAARRPLEWRDAADRARSDAAGAPRGKRRGQRLAVRMLLRRLRVRCGRPRRGVAGAVDPVAVQRGERDGEIERPPDDLVPARGGGGGGNRGEHVFAKLGVPTDGTGVRTLLGVDLARQSQITPLTVQAALQPGAVRARRIRGPANTLRRPPGCLRPTCRARTRPRSWSAPAR
jgi:hypothetical protein